MIRIIDARMGRGKSSAAAQYMNENKYTKTFLYVTPYLAEVNRMCELCDLEQPEESEVTKTRRLKNMLMSGKSIATTHSLFHLLDSECIEIIRCRAYTLIIDESIECIQRVQLSQADVGICLTMCNLRADGKLEWRDHNYDGSLLRKYYQYSKIGLLYYIDGAIIYILNPNVFNAFNNVIIMTYLFHGQYLQAYLDYFNFKYVINGIVSDRVGEYKFSNEPDHPKPQNYFDLINLITDDKLNSVGDKAYSLSKSWFLHRPRSDKKMTELRNNLNTFFRRRCPTPARYQLWTVFKSEVKKIIMDRNRFLSSFLHLSARATNEFRDCTSVAYLVNRYADPMINKFLARRGKTVAGDEFALSEMIQFIWRSAIRDGKPINLYIPSRRMRNLFTDWVEDIKQGDRA